MRYRAVPQPENKSPWEEIMNRYCKGAAFASFLALSITIGSAAAQTAKSVAGTYTAVSVPAFGDKPRGQMILTPQGRYAIVVSRATMQKIASGSRTKATPEENKAVVEGNIAHFGSYTIDDGGKAITFHIETSSYPNWDGTTQKRPLKVKGDQLIYTVAAPSAGGPPNDVIWKRVK
jgi:hypothetical protein